MAFKYIIIAVTAFLFTSCARNQAKQEAIATVQLFDRNGFSETISTPERVAMLEKNDFLAPQPYQKVICIYKKNNEGKAKSKLTTYHENGVVWQYLETVNGRANGIYREWFPNGTLKMTVGVIEGIGDLAPEAQTSWLFDGKSTVWNEEGKLIAEIFYEKGKIEGDSLYYHPNGAISKIIPYRKDLIEGALKVYNIDGEIIGSTNYIHGKKDGFSQFIGNLSIPKREEEYKGGLLISAKYFDFSGDLLSEVVSGYGKKPIFKNGSLAMQQEYRNGVIEGEISLYREDGSLETIYHVQNGQKQGEEWCYYDFRRSAKALQPMLHIHWNEDEIHGLVRTWYPNGILESEKEISHNKKHGMLLAWYEEGSLMLVEEYNQDRLVSGKYFRKGEDAPASRDVNGSGCATIFDRGGTLIKKIDYQKGIPSEL
jgi:antitoxin component YwqK of YwqJK toxin-antitoxin module